MTSIDHTATTTSQTAAPMLTAPRLSAYTDYREYLRDFYLYKREETRSSIRPYSYAHFSAAADIKSPNYLKLIIEAQRNLSSSMIRKFAKALQLGKEEQEEFTALVKYSQAKDPLERNQHLKELAEIRVRQQIKSGQIKEESWSRIPSWVTWVLYALADQKGVDFTVDSLKDLMRGKASPDEIKKSLGRLFDNGELVKTPSGEIKKGRPLMLGGNEDIPVALVRKLQSELIYLALESLFQDQPTDREFGAITLALTEKEFEHLKFELRQVRKRLFKDFTAQRQRQPGDRVFQLNIQLFPVTQGSNEPSSEK